MEKTLGLIGYVFQPIKINKYMKYIWTILLTLILLNTQAQELIWEVSVNTPKLQTADPKLFKQLESSIRDFLNAQKWTNENFRQEEKIKCNLQLTITQELSATQFQAQMAIQATRPIYGSDYETPILTHSDNEVQFIYEMFQPIQYSEGLISDNLSAVLSFYSLYILGVDFDTFSDNGGDKYFNRALELVNNIPESMKGQFKGWQEPKKTRINRFTMIDHILKPRALPFRSAIYQYHLNGLDVMSDDPDSGRKQMSDALETIEKVNNDFRGASFIQMYVNAKSPEIIEIFKNGTSDERNKIFKVMSRIDGANTSKYRFLRQ